MYRRVPRRALPVGLRLSDTFAHLLYRCTLHSVTARRTLDNIMMPIAIILRTVRSAETAALVLASKSEHKLLIVDNCVYGRQ